MRDNLQNSLSPPTIASTPVDHDNDGVVDQYNITLRIKKPLANLNLKQLNVIMAFDYALASPVSMVMEGLAIVNVDAYATKQLNAGTIITQGTLKMKQPNALQIPRGAGVRNVYDDRYFDTLQAQSMEQFLLNYHTTRNETLQYRYHKDVQYVDPGQQYIDVHMSLTVPHSDVLYVPGFWQILKLAWVKYLAQFLFGYYLLYHFFLNTIMTSNVFDTVKISEIDQNDRNRCTK